MSYYPQYPSLSPNLPSADLPGCLSPHLCTLKVEGSGTVTTQPDIAEILLGVSTESTNLTTAQAENAAAITAVINTLQRMGIAPQDIATQSYSISPQYDYVEGQQIFRGYRVIHMLRVTVRNIANVGQIIDAAVASGANVVSDISFTVANPSRFYQQALTLAIDDAIAKARTVGNKLNVNVSSIPVQLSEKTFEPSPVEPALFKTASAATPIQPGQLNLTARVEALFTYPCR